MTLLLTFYCARDDGESVVQALSAFSGAPVHCREEAVLGRDFGDALASERVAGTLARLAITLALPDGQADGAVEAVRAARRRLPFRWHSTAIIDGGRVE
jgi:hypothetical protein